MIFEKKEGEGQIQRICLKRLPSEAECGIIGSILRDARRMSNALMDTVEFPETVAAFVDRLADYEVSVIRSIAGCGVDAWMMATTRAYPGIPGHEDSYEKSEKGLAK